MFTDCLFLGLGETTLHEIPSGGDRSLHQLEILRLAIAPQYGKVAMVRTLK
ncbi:MAG: hypothetical protein AAFW75_19350 [Cyanobacteria bacterium J06636_16]